MARIKKLIGQSNPRAAGRFLILLPALFLVFHTLIIVGALPHTYVWGGRLTDTTLIPLELLALAINLLLLLTGCVSERFVVAPWALKLVERVKWFLFYFVVVNTVLALFSTTVFEVLMTPITALYALCLYRLIQFPDGLPSGKADP